MHNVFEFNISDKLVDEITGLINNDSRDFEPSDIYSTLSESKELRTDLRLSEKKLFYSDALFDAGQSILDMINSKMTDKKFIIYKNDITQIRYNPGGFFKSHEDYLSLTSNLIDEYTLILCVKGNCEGGHTLLHFNEFMTHTSSKTITPGGCLLFRKDIPHEGEILIAGTKEILTYNVWCINNLNIQRVLRVSFKNDLRQIYLDLNRVLDFPKNNAFIELLKLNTSDVVIPFECIHTYEEFCIIKKIYLSETISTDEFNKYVDVIKYYDFDHTDILIKTFESVSATKSHIYANSDMILFGAEEDYIAYIDTIKKYSIECVPFKMFFVEGTISYGGGLYGTKPVDISWRPCWFSFSEYDHVMLLQNVCSDIVDLSSDFYKVNVAIDESELNPILAGRYYEIDEEYDNLLNLIMHPVNETFSGMMAVCGMYAYKEDISNNDIINIITNHRMCDLILTRNNIMPISRKSSSYYLTDSNKISINDSQAKKIMEKASRIDLIKSIKDMLNTLNIKIRQSLTIDDSYCNENIYGNLKLVMIYGGLFMNESQ